MSIKGIFISLYRNSENEEQQWDVGQSRGSAQTNLQHHKRQRVRPLCQTTNPQQASSPTDLPLCQINTWNVETSPCIQPAAKWTIKTKRTYSPERMNRCRCGHSWRLSTEIKRSLWPSSGRHASIFTLCLQRNTLSEELTFVLLPWRDIVRAMFLYQLCFL